MEAVSSSEISVDFYQTTRHHDIEDTVTAIYHLLPNFLFKLNFVWKTKYLWDHTNFSLDTIVRTGILYLTNTYLHFLKLKWNILQTDNLLFMSQCTFSYDNNIRWSKYITVIQLNISIRTHAGIVGYCNPVPKIVLYLYNFSVFEAFTVRYFFFYVYSIY